jgi:ArsR family transcriptional regulator
MTYDASIDIFKALAHPARLQIMDILRHGEQCVCHIETALGKRQAYVSQQLMILREAGLVDNRKDGLRVYYRATSPQALAILEAALGTTTDAPLERLADCPCPQCEHEMTAIER